MSESKVWNTLIEIEKYFESKFYETGSIIHEPGMERFNQPGWINKVWQSSRYRRAHIDVVDARNTKGLWMMHCCIFPYVHNPAPIFGFDVVAGKNKITGCFYDYSPAGDKSHPMLEWFAHNVQDLQWKKTRTLPDWAERIFSENMIAASNVQSDEELEQIYKMATQGIDHYLDTVSQTNDFVEETVIYQNYYAINQKQNPHTPRVMASLGLNEDDIAVFIQDCLFPEIR